MQVRPCLTTSGVCARPYPRWILSFVLIVAACGGENPAVWRGTIDTLENGVIHVKNPAEGIWAAGEGWQLIEEGRIGAREGAEFELFGRIGDIEVDAGGRVYILDFQAQNIRVFGPEGSYVRTIGRPGAGPGEFKLAAGMAFDPVGRLWVMNQGNLRYSVFDTAGTLLEEFRRPGGAARFVDWRGLFRSGGDLFDVVVPMTAVGLKLAWVRYDTTSQQFVDTILSPEVRGTRHQLPFGWVRSLTTPSGQWVGRADEYLLFNTTFDGRDTVRIVERSYERVPLAGEERDSAEQLVDSLNKRLARDVPDLPMPKYDKIYEGMVGDDAGFLWVLLSVAPDSQKTTIDVFDPEGRYLGHVSAPDRVESYPKPVINGDRIYYLTKDELDVPFVVSLRIEGRD